MSCRTVAAERKTNAVHRGFPAQYWEGLKHILLCFHDETFECLAEDWAVELVSGTFKQVVDLAVHRVFETK
jgi:hypothetical protein